MSDLIDTTDLIHVMNSTDYLFLALAIASITTLIVILLRQRPETITPPTVPLQRIGKAPHYRLPRGSALLEELLAIAFCLLIALTMAACLSDLDLIAQP